MYTNVECALQGINQGVSTVVRAKSPGPVSFFNILTPPSAQSTASSAPNIQIRTAMQAYQNTG